jgi:hypothetical protein
MHVIQAGLLTAGSGPSEKNFSGPPAMADQLQIFMLNWKE